MARSKSIFASNKRTSNTSYKTLIPRHITMNTTVQNPNRPTSPKARCRKGTIAVLALILMVVLTGMLAFSIDLGYLATSKSEIQRTADSAALAACWQVYESRLAGVDEEDARSDIASSASQVAWRNKISNTSPSLHTCGESSDVQLGYLPSLAYNQTLTNNSHDPFRAVRVRVHKSSSMNGQIPSYFGRVFGRNGSTISAEATAAMAHQIRGFKIPPGSSLKIGILPVALDSETWQSLLAGNTSDQYSYDSTTGAVTKGSDGICEVNLYPQGTGSPGNRGTVDIGNANNSTADIARQIVEGISAEDLQELGKPLALSLDGTLELNGDTGISAGVKDELTSIIGQTRIVPVFDQVTGNGNNATYRIVRWVGVRVLYVKLTGQMNSKRLVIQPAAMVAKGVIVGDGSKEWSENIFSPVVLAN